MAEQTLEQRIKQIRKQEARNGRFSGSIVITPSDEFSGEIDTKTLSNIQVSYDSGYDGKVAGREEPTKLIEQAEKTGTELIVSDIIAHEINHKGYGNCHGCPGKGGEEGFKIHLDSFVEPIFEVIKAKGYSVNDAYNFANALEDLCENSELRFIAQKENLGLALFYENACSEKGLSPYFDAFLRTQMTSWGNLKQAKMLFDYSTEDSEKRKEILEVKRMFLKRIGFDGKSRRELAGILANPENWREISKVFAEEFSKLAQPGMTFIPVVSAGRFEREIKDRDMIARYVFGKYASGESNPSFLPLDESLILLYEQLAKKLDIKVESKTISEQMPMVHYGKRKFDPRKDKLKRLKFGLDGSGELELKTTRYSIDYPIAIKQNPEGFPEFRVAFIDASESTKHSPICSGCSGYSCSGSKRFIPWGDKSIYHYEVLSVEGIVEFLKQNNLLRKETFKAGAFSSGFRQARRLDESMKLLMQPEFGGTAFYQDGIDSVFSGSRNLVFTMSDGDIWNWNYKLTKNQGSEEDEMEKRTTKEYYLAKAQNHFYFHLHFGRANEFTRDLDNAGLPVFYMTEGDEFVRKAIDLTRRIYRN